MSRPLFNGKIIGSVDNRGLISVVAEAERVVMVLCDPQGLVPAQRHSFTGDQAIQLGTLLQEAGIRFNISGKPVPRGS